MAYSKRFEKASYSNVPHFFEKTALIVSSYCFSGINFLICSHLYDVRTCVLGVIFLIMVPITFWDKRKEMRGTLYTVLSCIMHFAFCIIFSILYSFWWLAIYCGEVVLSVLAIAIAKKVLKIA